MDEKNEQKSRNVVVEFIRAYKHKPNDQSSVDWLNSQFAKYPELWTSEIERKKDAETIVATIEKFDNDKAEFEAHIASGKSHESYLIGKIEAAATAQGVTNVASYAANIDKAISDANKDMIERCYCHNPDGSIDFTRINQNPNLDGNIAETHHAGTFNIDAAAKESDLHAKTLTSNNKNSVDLQIYDNSGKVVRRYQSKYGKDAEATGDYFKNGDYRGQRKLAPEGQAEELPGSTDHMEANGVRSKSLSKEEAKRMQERMQKEGRLQQYEWNDANKVAITKAIGKKAAIAGVLAVGFQGARILGRRVWNWVTGKENQGVEEDLKEFVTSSIQSAGGSGLAVATTGGITVAVKSGWLGHALKATPVGHIANAVCIGIENIKILYRLGTGQITGKEALDQAGNATCSLVGGLVGAGKGAAIGGAIGTICGPVGSVIGSVAGSIVGAIAGSTVGQAIYSGAKAICTGVTKVASAAWSGIKSAGRAIAGLFGF
ncbi:MAG: hypothetical protein GX946_07160 [Oligosphaeraceae bacterium]|nr:hypothetical protein [Oligosphaeraceae bacterium]